MGQVTPKQQRFVEEYLVDLNASEAAKRAGYKEKTARHQGSRLLTKANIQRLIQVKQAERSQATGVTANRVVEELRRVALSDVRKLFDEQGNLKAMDALDEETAAAIAAVDIVTASHDDAPIMVKKVKLWDKGAALDKLMRHLGAYAPDKVDVDVTDKAARIWKARNRVSDGD